MQSGNYLRQFKARFAIRSSVGKQYLAKLLHCMAWNYQAAKQKRSGVQAIAGSGTFESGMKQAAIARALNVTRGAVSQWLSAYRDKGLEALRYRKITKIHVGFRKNKRWTTQTPGAWRWTFRLSRSHLDSIPCQRSNFTKIRDIVLHIQCCCHPEKIGWTCQKPVVRATQRDEEASKNGFRKNGRK